MYGYLEIKMKSNLMLSYKKIFWFKFNSNNKQLRKKSLFSEYTNFWINSLVPSYYGTKNLRINDIHT
jgi:hypothetical protein